MRPEMGATGFLARNVIWHHVLVSCDWSDSSFFHAGQKTSKPLLDGSQLWHEAAAQLPALDSSNAPPADGAIIETKTRVAEKLMEAEAAGCQKRLAKSNPADARWLQDVRTCNLSLFACADQDHTVDAHLHVHAVGCVLPLQNVLSHIWFRRAKCGARPAIWTCFSRMKWL